MPAKVATRAHTRLRAHAALAALAALAIAFVAAAVGSVACGGDTDGAPSRFTDAELDAVVSAHVEFRENRDVFTTFAFLNAAGLDDESPAAAHPVRRAVRSALPRVVLDPMFERIEAFSAAHRGVPAEVYACAALGAVPAGAAPSADATAARAGVPPEFPSLLDAFAREFRADSIYAAHQRAYDAYLADQRSVARRETGALLRYARVESQSELAAPARGPVVTVPNLLAAHGTRVVCEDGSATYAIEGPQRLVSFDVYPVALGIVRAALAERGDTAGTLAASVARALAIAYTPARTDADARLAEAARQAERGLTLVPWLVDRMARYERQRRGFRDWIPELLEQLEASGQRPSATG